MIDFLDITDNVNNYDGLVVVGDIHGNWAEFETAINYAVKNNLFLLSLGDVIDYGRENVKCFDELNTLINAGQAHMIIGNHEFKMIKYIKQNRENDIKIQLRGGILNTIENMRHMTESDLVRFEDDFLKTCENSCFIAKYGNYYFTHGSIDRKFWNNHEFSKATKSMALFGQIDNKAEPRPDGYPTRRYEWVDSIPDGLTVIVGHDIRDTESPVTHKGMTGGKAIFLDTGSSKGGRLSLMRIES